MAVKSKGLKRSPMLVGESLDWGSTNKRWMSRIDSYLWFSRILREASLLFLLWYTCSGSGMNWSKPSEFLLVALVKLKIVESPDDLSKIIQILTFIKQSIKTKKKTQSCTPRIERFILGNDAKMLSPNSLLELCG